MTTYERTHPWIQFHLDLRGVDAELWMLLGEARSKCEHLAGVPLRPETARELNQVYLAKGALATTAIEGNTLSEQQVRLQLEGKLELPPSQEYLAREVQNIVDACNAIWDSVLAGAPPALTPERIAAFNAEVLRGLEVADEVRPGAFRGHEVGVFRYRGAPAADCPYLVGRLCDWLAEDGFQPNPSMGIVPAILAAIMAHLYLAWIHPFGDGNGRTARLVEYAILVSAGVPMPAAHLLSNHYNLTRAEYYRQLDRASQSGGDVIPFLRYATQGLVDGLREQLALVREQQHDVTWCNYVYEHFRDHAGETAKRRRDLLLDLSDQPAPVAAADIKEISPHMMRLYAPRSAKTLQRDLDELRRMGLVEATGDGRWRARTEIIEAFMPARRRP